MERKVTVKKAKNIDNNPAMLPLLGVPARGIIPRALLLSKYPLSCKLGLRPVAVNGNEYEGFDIEEVEKKLGATRFESLKATLKSVFCCAHRTWPANHPDPHLRNAEVHCVYFDDVESFLRNSVLSQERK